MGTEQAVERLRSVAAQYRGLQLLMLYGSRARGEEHARSDWDIGYLADRTLNSFALLGEVTQVLQTDAVDLVDLERASGLLRFRAASEGLVVYESAAGAYHDFAVAAALYWYDVEPIVRRTHDDILARLG